MLNAIADFMSGIPGIDWLPPVIEHWWHLPLGGKVFEVVRLILEIAGIWELFVRRIYGWIFHRRDHLERRIKVLEEGKVLHEQEIVKLRADLADRTTELSNARERLPEAAIAKAEREWRDKNKTLALRHLEEWYTANAPSIATISTHLAKYHLAEAIPVAGDHLTRAAAMIRIARGATLDSREALELSIQFDHVNGELQAQLIHDGDRQIGWNDNIGQEPGGVSLIITLRDVAGYCFDRGFWRLAPIFADRASDLAARGGAQTRKLWCEAETRAAYYQSSLGQDVEAAERLNAVLAVANGVYPDRDPVVLTARHCRAQTLSNLGRHAEALSEIDAFAPIQAEALGPRHPNTLATRYLRAHTLSDLGRYAEALAEIDAFAPIEAEVLGARHRNTLATASLRIGIQIASGAGGNASNEQIGRAHV